MAVIGAVFLSSLIAGQGGTDPRPSLPFGSSRATSQQGTSAFAGLLRLLGYEVGEALQPFADVAPDPESTVVVLGGTALSVEDRTALTAFVAAGGRLVIDAGRGPSLSIAPLEPPRPGEVGRRLLPLAELSDVDAVDVFSASLWKDTGPAVPAIGTASAVAVAVSDEGRVWHLSDARLVTNGAIGERDNAALAVALVGDPERRVVFAEYLHGLSTPTGLAALPERWRAALWLASLGAIVWLAAKARRLGPPEESSRSLPPPRAAYIDAVAGLLARTREPSVAAAPLQRYVTHRLRSRGAWSGTATDLDRAATVAGIPAPDLRAALGDLESTSDVLALGRVAAHLAVDEPSRSMTPTLPT